MRTLTTVIIFSIVATQANATDLVFGFNSPAFNGIGWGSHVLTIEQLEQQGRDAAEAKQKAADDQIARELRGTNSYKFKNNLESRIYAQLSKQITETLFGDQDGTWDEGEWVETDTPFGDTVSWKREADRIYVTISDSNGDTVAEFDVPVGDFSL